MISEKINITYSITYIEINYFNSVINMYSIKYTS